MTAALREKPVSGLVGKSCERRAKRVRCAIPAKIEFQGVRLADCVIKDISSSGLLLYVPRAQWLPHTFRLASFVFEKEFQVQTVWSNREHVGVKILTDQK